MTEQRDFKALIRQRMAATGEPYTKARTRLVADRARRLLAAAAPDTEPTQLPLETTGPRRVEAVVLKVLEVNARVRMMDDGREVTFRGEDLFSLIPGHLAELELLKEWGHRGVPYASGRVLSSRLDVRRLGMVPIPLHRDGERKVSEILAEKHLDVDTRAYFKAFFVRDVPVYRMDDVAYVWAGDRGEDDGLGDDDIVGVANDLSDSGDHAGARRVLMESLLPDLRFLDAHAHLGNRAFDVWPATALQHYEVGVAIGDLSLGADFHGVLPWACCENRAYLRCLNGYGLALWKVGRRTEAESVMRRLLRLNPSDNQQVGWCLAELRSGLVYDELERAGT